LYIAITKMMSLFK